MMLLEKLSPEDKLLLVYTRQNFHHLHRKAVIDICSNSEIQWSIVYSTANLHGVAPLVYSNLLKCDIVQLGVPQDTLKQFKLCIVNSVIKKERRAERIAEILSLSNEKSIDVMLIKGAALDVLVYDHPWYMVPGDIDLIVRSKKEGITDKEKGEIPSMIRRHGIECEYFVHHDVNMNGLLPINFQNIWENAIKIEFRGYGAFVMSPEDMLMSVCINSCRKRFFRLKSLCDIAEIVSKYRDLKWEKLIKDAKEYQCNNIVYTALLVTQMTLECELPEDVLDELSGSAVRTAIIRYLVRYFIQNMSLSSSFPYFKRNEKNKLIRKIDASLVLPYATYRWYQLWVKMRHNWNTKPWR